MYGDNEQKVQETFESNYVIDKHRFIQRIFVFYFILKVFYKINLQFSIQSMFFF